MTISALFFFPSTCLGSIFACQGTVASKPPADHARDHLFKQTRAQIVDHGWAWHACGHTHRMDRSSKSSVPLRRTKCENVLRLVVFSVSLVYCSLDTFFSTSGILWWNRPFAEKWQHLILIKYAFIIIARFILEPANVCLPAVTFLHVQPPLWQMIHHVIFTESVDISFIDIL